MRKNQPEYLITDTKKNTTRRIAVVIITAILLINGFLINGCAAAEPDTVQNQKTQEEFPTEQQSTEQQTVLDMESQESTEQESTEQASESTELQASEATELQASEATELQTSETTELQASATKPASSYGLGSAPFLRGKNLVVSVFLSEQNSSWTESEMETVRMTLLQAFDQIYASAEEYGVSLELCGDWSKEPSLMYTEQVDYAIAGSGDDYFDALDASIAQWLEQDIDYAGLLKAYRADGIVSLIFVNQPGVSYAIVYDGEDNPQETAILFYRDNNHGKIEAAAVYAHELIHTFGAHDLYADAEYTQDITDFIGNSYPNDIMYTVNKGSKITDITAYELGWIDALKWVEQYPDLRRD